MIKLRPGAHEFVIFEGPGTVGAATPSPLLLGGRSFQISYSEVAAHADRSFARPRGTYLVHPGR
jgi:hypothetical protein